MENRVACRFVRISPPGVSVSFTVSHRRRHWHLVRWRLDGVAVGAGALAAALPRRRLRCAAHRPRLQHDSGGGGGAWS